ncbi:MAG: hypothetical protein ACKVQC_04960, partial [Elusimicrobiota bacterium]
MKKTILLLTILYGMNIILSPLAQASIWGDRRKALESKEKPVLLAAVPTQHSDIRFPGINFNQPQSNSLTALINNNGKNNNIPANSKNIIGIIARNKGLVKETFFPRQRNSSPILIIQDVHLNNEAQENISNILQELISKEEIDSVSVEGVEGPFDVERFQAFPNKDLIYQASKDFMVKNLINAPSFVAINNQNLDLHFQGVDDNNHYKKNILAYKNSIKNKSQLTSEINSFTETLIEKKALTSPELQQIFKLREQYEKGNIEWGAYVKDMASKDEELDFSIEQFLGAYNLEKTLNFSLVDNQRKLILEKLTKKLSDQEVNFLFELSLAHRAGNISFGDFFKYLQNLCQSKNINLKATPQFEKYIQYVLLTDQINPDKLLTAIENLQERVFHRFSKSEEEKTISQLDQFLIHLNKLASFSLTPQEWISYKDLKKKIEQKNIIPKFNIAENEQFYIEADIRSEKMLTKVLSFRQRKPIVLITGGFHTFEITSTLKKKNIPFITISPKLEKIETLNGSEYLSVFSSEKAPLEKLFAGEKLFLQPESSVGGFPGGPQSIVRTTLIAVIGVLHLLAGMATPQKTGIINHSSKGNNYTIVTAGENSPPQTFIARTDAAPTESGELETSGIRIHRSTPGAWAVLIEPIFKLFEKNIFKKIKPSKLAQFKIGTSGFIEGSIAAFVFITYRDQLLIATSLWFIANAFIHLFGIYYWDTEKQKWVIKSFIKLGSRPSEEGFTSYLGGRIHVNFSTNFFQDYWIAIFKSSTSLLGFIYALFSGNVFMILFLSIVPHVSSAYSNLYERETKRRRAVDELADKMDKYEKLLDAINQNKLGNTSAFDQKISLTGETDSELQSLLNEYSVAQLLHLKKAPFEKMRLIRFSRPGTTYDGEGPGIKTLNDTIGFNANDQVIDWTMNFLYEELTRELRTQGLLSDSAGFIKLAVESKGIVVAVPDDGRISEQQYIELAKKVTENVSARMISELTKKRNGDQNNRSNEAIVSLVQLFQKEGKLPEELTFPLYFGMSEQFNSSKLTAEELVVKAATTMTAANLYRALKIVFPELEDSSQYSLFSQNSMAFLKEEYRKTIDELINLKAGSIKNGSYFSLDVPIKNGSNASKREILKKHFKDPQTIERIIFLINKEGLLKNAFDFQTPWVGSNQKEEIIEQAIKLEKYIGNTKELTIDEIVELRSLLLRHPRFTEMGSKAGYFGETVTDNPLSEEEKNNPRTAYLFIDARGFGDRIKVNLAQTAYLIAEQSPENILDAYASAMLTLGDGTLNPFAAMFTEIKQYIDDYVATQDSPAQNYFGGDDNAFAVPLSGVYTEDAKELKPGLIEEIFKITQKHGFPIRMLATSTLPYLSRTRAEDTPNKKKALAISLLDILTDVSKGIEKNNAIFEEKVEQAVVYADGVEAFYARGIKLEKNNLIYNDPVLIKPGQEFTNSIFVRAITRIKSLLSKTILGDRSNPNRKLGRFFEWTGSLSFIATGFNTIIIYSFHYALSYVLGQIFNLNAFLIFISIPPVLIVWLLTPIQKFLQGPPSTVTTMKEYSKNNLISRIKVNARYAILGEIPGEKRPTIKLTKIISNIFNGGYINKHTDRIFQSLVIAIFHYVAVLSLGMGSTANISATILFLNGFLILWVSFTSWNILTLSHLQIGPFTENIAAKRAQRKPFLLPTSENEKKSLSAVVTNSVPTHDLFRRQPTGGLIPILYRFFIDSRLVRVISKVTGFTNDSITRYFVVPLIEQIIFSIPLIILANHLALIEGSPITKALIYFSIALVVQLLFIVAHIFRLDSTQREGYLLNNFVYIISVAVFNIMIGALFLNPNFSEFVSIFIVGYLFHGTIINPIAKGQEIADFNLSLSRLINAKDEKVSKTLERNGGVNVLYLPSLLSQEIKAVETIDDLIELSATGNTIATIFKEQDPDIYSSVISFNQIIQSIETIRTQISELSLTKNSMGNITLTRLSSKLNYLFSIFESFLKKSENHLELDQQMLSNAYTILNNNRDFLGARYDKFLQLLNERPLLEQMKRKSHSKILNRILKV